MSNRVLLCVAILMFGLPLIVLEATAGAGAGQWSQVSNVQEDARTLTGTEADLVVHEWGTFTSMFDKRGSALKWRWLDKPDDLPTFVYGLGRGHGEGLRHGKTVCVKCEEQALVRMETPVLYFYSPHETTISVRVDFPDGKITEWYPHARMVLAGIDWGRLSVLPDASVELPTEREDSHYYAARETDAAAVRVCGRNGDQYERFLFYRGIGNFALPVSLRPVGETLMVRNSLHGVSVDAVLFENRNGTTGYRAIELGGGDTVLERPDTSVGENSFPAYFEEILIRKGLYPREARSMIETWRESWCEPGLRLFYIVPREVVDKILPVYIVPAPREIQRVFVGRAELVAPVAGL